MATYDPSALGLIGSPITGNPLADQLGVDRFRSTTGDVVGAEVEQGLFDNTVNRVARDITSNAYSTGFVTDPWSGYSVPVEPNIKTLDPDQANAQYGIKDASGKPLLSFDQPIAEPVAQQLYQQKRDQIAREDTLNRAEGGLLQTPAKYGTQLLTGMLDPANVAATFIPVVGEARYAQWLAGAAGPIERFGIRAGVGAAQGAVGTAVLQPVEALQASLDHNDYSMTDALLNTAIGTALGGGLHATLGGIFGDAVHAVSPDTREAMLRGALAAVAEDRPVRADLALRDALLNGTTADRLPDLDAILNSQPVDPVIAAREAKARAAADDAGVTADNHQAEFDRLTAARQSLADELAQPILSPDALENAGVAPDSVGVLRDIEDKMAANPSAQEMARLEAERQGIHESIAGEIADARSELKAQLAEYDTMIKNQGDVLTEAKSSQAGANAEVARLKQVSDDRAAAARQPVQRPTAATSAPEIARTRPEPLSRDELRQQLRDDLRAYVEQQRKPYADPADIAGARAATARVQSAAAGGDSLASQIAEQQRHLDVANEMLAQHADAGRISAEDVAHIAGKDLDQEADSLGKAYQAAAACLASGT